METKVVRERVLDWSDIFEVLPVETEIKYHVQCHCGSGRCAAAKKVRCVCSCRHANHGKDYKDRLTKLDEVLTNAQGDGSNGPK